MTIFDHLLVLTIAVIQPISGYISFNKLVRRFEAGETVRVTHLYDSIMAGHWLLFGVVVILWRSLDRSWDSLGFGLEINTSLWIGLALTIAVVVFMLVQLRQIASGGAETVSSLRTQLGKLEFIFPRNNNELGRFYAVSVTAGVVEETLWRGFLFWYLGHVMPLWAAALVSSVGFGLAHIYQGTSNVPKVILIGAGFSGLYLLTGSLWLPMILHAVFDMIQGRAVYGIIRSGVRASECPSP